jgi:competence protein ComFC
MPPLPYRLYRLLWASLDWLYPPVCCSCSTKGSRWCPACQSAARPIRPPLCPCCGRPQAGASPCRRCQASPPSYTALRAWAGFRGPLRQAVHSLKYKGNLSLGDVLARPLIQLLPALTWRVDLVIPVPLAIARFRERGYNQAELLARPIALALGIPYASKALVKIRETRPQVDLKAAQRVENVSGAFRGEGRMVSRRSVLVIDDVATTGATLEACSAALKEAGASAVYCLTLARAVYDPY